MIDSERHGTHLALAVDDDSRVRWYIKSILETVHFTVLEARDGREALDLFRLCRGRLEIIVTDIRMPHMTGTELAAAVRSESPGLPLIFISGEPAPTAADDPAAGCIFVEKPFAPEVLLEAVRRALRHSTVGCP